MSVVTVTPRDFGALGDGVSDDTEALQRFFDHIADNPGIRGDFIGEWLVSDTVHIRGEPGTQFLSGKIRAIASIDGALVEIEGRSINFDGTFELEGYSPGGHAFYENRTVTTGLKLIEAGGTEFDKIEARGFRRFAVDVDGPRNNQLNLGDVRVLDAGSIGRAEADGSENIATVALAITGVLANGLTGPGQAARLSLGSAVPDEIRAGDLARIDGRPYLILSVGGGEVEIYPAIDAADLADATLYSLHGGAVSFAGNDAGSAYIESISSIRVGTSLKAASLYGQTVETLHSEGSGVGLQIGQQVSGSGRRIVVNGTHFEGTAFDVVQTGGSDASVTISGFFSSAGGIDKIFRLSPLLPDGSYRDETLDGVTIIADTVYDPDGGGEIPLDRILTDLGGSAFGAIGAVETLSNDADGNRIFSNRDNVEFLLGYESAADRLFGLNTVEIFAFGSGANAEVAGEITISITADDAAAGIAIRGGPLVLSGLSEPAYILARFDQASREWVLSLFSLETLTPLILSEQSAAELPDGTDELYGGGIDDVLKGFAGDDFITGRGGDDSLYGGNGADELVGGAGNDLARGGAQGDLLFGGTGDDRVFGDDGHDRLAGGTGADTLSGGRHRDVLLGQDGDDRLIGGFHADRLFGGAGADSLSGGTGADHLLGDEGNDRLSGDQGADFLDGGAGNDVLRGGPGQNRLEGGTGNDRLFGGAQSDLLFGGDGRDVLTGGGGWDSFFGGAGDDRIVGGVRSDFLDGGLGRDGLYGGRGLDRLFGGAGNDRLIGGDDGDVLDGGDGDDGLYGGAGGDRLAGGAGSDILVGGAGADRFEFIAADGVDRIRDFEAGRDRIDLSALGIGFEDLRVREIASGLRVTADEAVFIIEGFEQEDLARDWFAF